jgi:two-component system, OmpR family, response regulator
LTLTTSIPLQTILLVEDEQELANEIKIELDRQGYLVRTASIAEAADAARVGDAAMMIMDRLVFGEDSLKTVEVLRKEGVKVPVLMISALSSIDERIRGLTAGGDDYLTKPFAMAELAARVQALLRRLDELLEYFLRHPGQVITRAMLLKDVWHYHFSLETNVVDVHISNLRKKIDVRGSASLIVNIRGAGFMLNENA